MPLLVIVLSAVIGPTDPPAVAPPIAEPSAPSNPATGAATDVAAPPVREATSPPRRDTPPVTESVEDQLRRAKNEYAYGDYAKAIGSLQDLLYPMRLYSDDQVIEARRYLGLALVLLGRRDE